MYQCSCLFEQFGPWVHLRVITEGRWNQNQLISAVLYLTALLLIQKEDGDWFNRLQEEECSVLASLKRYIFICVCLLYVGLHKNCWTDFHETWMKDGSRPWRDRIKFSCGSGWRDGSRTFFSLSLTLPERGRFFDITVNFSGINAEINCI